MDKEILTQERLKELLHYEPTTGVFTWLVHASSRARIGDAAGTPHNQGYLSIRIKSRLYLAHRLAWLWAYGDWPVNHIDHINGQKRDNRLINLRDVSRSENQQNIRQARKDNQSGILGVCWSNKLNKWVAQIGVDRKVIYLGLYPTAEDAYDAYLTAKRRYHPAGTL